MRVRALLDRIKFVERDRFADWNWEDVATRYVLNTVSLDEYDLIYSTGGPAVAHLVAHNLIKHCGLNTSLVKMFGPCTRPDTRFQDGHEEPSTFPV